MTLLGVQPIENYFQSKTNEKKKCFRLLGEDKADGHPRVRLITARMMGYSSSLRYSKRVIQSLFLNATEVFFRSKDSLEV
jgi:hypothetical protein